MDHVNQGIIEIMDLPLHNYRAEAINLAQKLAHRTGGNPEDFIMDAMNIVAPNFVLSLFLADIVQYIMEHQREEIRRELEWALKKIVGEKR